MTVTRDRFKMFSFSVMQSTFFFSNVKILAVPTTSLIHNFRHLRTVDPILIGEKRLDAMSALENNPKINATMKSNNAGRQLFNKIYIFAADLTRSVYFHSFFHCHYFPYLVLVFVFKFNCILGNRYF